MARRQNPFQWLRYAVGGRLPETLREWVLRDVTARTWVWRHVARMSVMVAPLALAGLLLPARLGLRSGSAPRLAIVGASFSLSCGEESGDMRAVKHGHAPGRAKEIREARKEE